MTTASGAGLRTRTSRRPAQAFRRTSLFARNGQLRALADATAAAFLRAAPERCRRLSGVLISARVASVERAALALSYPSLLQTGRRVALLAAVYHEREVLAKQRAAAEGRAEAARRPATPATVPRRHDSPRKRRSSEITCAPLLEMGICKPLYPSSRRLSDGRRRPPQARPRRTRRAFTSSRRVRAILAGGESPPPDCTSLAASVSCAFPLNAPVATALFLTASRALRDAHAVRSRGRAVRVAIQP